MQTYSHSGTVLTAGGIYTPLIGLAYWPNRLIASSPTFANGE